MYAAEEVERIDRVLALRHGLDLFAAAKAERDCICGFVLAPGNQDHWNFLFGSVADLLTKPVGRSIDLHADALFP